MRFPVVVTEPSDPRMAYVLSNGLNSAHPVPSFLTCVTTCHVRKMSCWSGRNVASRTVTFASGGSGVAVGSTEGRTFGVLLGTTGEATEVVALGLAYPAAGGEAAMG